MDLLFALLPICGLILLVSYRLEKASDLDEAERLASCDQSRQHSAEMLGLLDDIKHASPQAAAVLWQRYRLAEYGQAQRQVQHILRWGMQEDHWNYRQNLDGALKRQHEAAMAAEPYRHGVVSNGPREGTI